MAYTNSFVLDQGWRIVIKDLGLDPYNVLKRAKLPGDLFVQDEGRLPPKDYFRLWESLAEESGDPLLPITLGKMIAVEHFSPPVFAAFCSPDLNTAIRRLGRYKALICPMKLELDKTDKQSVISLRFHNVTEAAPASLLAFELVFMVNLGRLATREEIQPIQIITTVALQEPEVYAEYFGVTPQLGETNEIIFSAEDAALPFLTANEKMWEFFEPELRRRLSELDNQATTKERVKSVLLELLPSGRTSIQDVAQSLHVSTRTLQRRLKGEDTNFQKLLNESREGLARHYLKNSSLSGAEISFLLGFDEPNSFFRAFHAWTGETPERVRLSS